MLIDGKEAGRAALPYTPPLNFTASETFDVGIDLGSPVALDYHARAPFAFNGGRIHDVHVRYP
jgi:arylsulfatase